MHSPLHSDPSSKPNINFANGTCIPYSPVTRDILLSGSGSTAPYLVRFYK